MENSKLEGLQVSVKEEVIIKVLLEILYKQGYISNMCYFKSIGMLKKWGCKIGKIWYNVIRKGNRHRVVDQVRKSKTFSHSGKVQGRFFAVLMTNQINECQQC